MKKVNWCTEFFDDVFAEQFLICESQGRMAKEVRFLKDILCLGSGDTVFDQCCGTGRLSVPLSKKGYSMVGVDIIPSYIARAKTDSVGLPCRFYVGDASGFVTDKPCDAAINWWTSFGYADDDADNLKVLQRVYESLRPGGWFALDYLNVPYCLAGFKGQDTVTHSKTHNGVVSSWTSVLSKEKDKIIKLWSYEGSDGVLVEKRGGGVKLYTAGDLKRMLVECGFESIYFYGGLDKDTLTATSTRCIAVAQKGAS